MIQDIKNRWNSMNQKQKYLVAGAIGVTAYFATNR